MKKQQNEELQSRREFFKKAAKGALPILGAIVLANAPVIAKAAESESAMGCRYEPCVGGCHNGCTRGCRDICTSCHNGCTSGCKDICTGCHNGCSGNCKSSSRY